MSWQVIKISDFVKKLPNQRPSVVWEVNASGEIRKYNPLAYHLRYIDVTPDVREDGAKTVTFVIGWAYSAVIRKTLLVDDIVKKYFKN